MTDEEYVRSVWEAVSPHAVLREKGWNISIGVKEFNIYPCSYGQPELWSAAAEFTRERLEQIRQVEEEIAEIVDDLDCFHIPRDERLIDIYSRILAREQAALAELKQGMKESA